MNWHKQMAKTLGVICRVIIQHPKDERCRMNSKTQAVIANWQENFQKFFVIYL